MFKHQAYAPLITGILILELSKFQSFQLISFSSNFQIRDNEITLSQALC